MMDLLMKVLWVLGHAGAAAVVATFLALMAEVRDGSSGITAGFMFVFSWPIFFGALLFISFLIW